MWFISIYIQKLNAKKCEEDDGRKKAARNHKTQWHLQYAFAWNEWNSHYKTHARTQKSITYIKKNNNHFSSQIISFFWMKFFFHLDTKDIIDHTSKRNQIEQAINKNKTKILIGFIGFMVVFECFACLICMKTHFAKIRVRLTDKWFAREHERERKRKRDRERYEKDR